MIGAPIDMKAWFAGMKPASYEVKPVKQARYDLAASLIPVPRAGAGGVSYQSARTPDVSVNPEYAPRRFSPKLASYADAAW